MTTPEQRIGMIDNDFTVTQKEAADFLQVSTKSISRYRKRGLPYKLILNPVAGKQEVRFCYADLERWHEGRQLLATYARDAAADSVDSEGGSGKRESQRPEPANNQALLADLLAAYKEQIELLRDQLEDMREQLARRDRQIDDLMRLMVGLQLEYKPMAVVPTDAGAAIIQEAQRTPDLPYQMRSERLFETIPLPEHFQQTQKVATPTLTPQDTGSEKKIYSREQLSASILRLRRKGKSYAEIAGALNQIEAATLSGQPQWTVPEVRALLPGLMDSAPQSWADRGEF